MTLLTDPIAVQPVQPVQSVPPRPTPPRHVVVAIVVALVASCLGLGITAGYLSRSGEVDHLDKSLTVQKSLTAKAEAATDEAEQATEDAESRAQAAEDRADGLEADLATCRAAAKAQGMNVLTLLDVLNDALDGYYGSALAGMDDMRGTAKLNACLNGDDSRSI